MNGGGGAGWFGNGGPGSGGESGDGGFGPLIFTGGLGYGVSGSSNDDGGFGGGGGGGLQGGGGGGGYSGGGGGDGRGADDGYGGGGGGSYSDPSFTGLIATAGAQSGNGYVSIDLIAPSIATPEPCSLILLGMGGVSFAVYGWRRRKQS